MTWNASNIEGLSFNDGTLTGNVTNLSEIIARLETLMDVKTLDLSQITGISELRLDNTKLDSFCEHEESQSL